MNEVRIDPSEIDTWIEGLGKEDLIRAFIAIKTLELIKFKKTIGEDIEEVLQEWSNLR